MREGGEETREWRGEYEESDGGEKRRREEEEELMLDARVDEAAIEKVMKFGPFVDWMAGINRIHNADTARPELIVDKVHIQQIDMFGPKIGFLKFEVSLFSPPSPLLLSPLPSSLLLSPPLHLV